MGDQSPQQDAHLLPLLMKAWEAAAPPLRLPACVQKAAATHVHLPWSRVLQVSPFPASGGAPLSSSASLGMGEDKLHIILLLPLYSMAEAASAQGKRRN